MGQIVRTIEYMKPLTLTSEPFFDGGLLTHPTEFDHSDWQAIGYSVTPNNILSPFGGMTADRLTEDTSFNFHGVQQINIPKAAENLVYNSFCHFKAGTNTFAFLHHQSGAADGGRFQAYNLSTGALHGSVGGFGSGASGGTGNIVDVGGGWFRCELNGVTIESGFTTMRIFLAPNEGPSYTGNGTDFGYLYGARMVQV